MIDHVIANAIPSDIGLFGVYMHGLFKTPNRAYYQSEVEVVTRSGGHVTLESLPEETSYGHPQHNPPSILPRPILYMHPSAVMRQEAVDGTDFSGYCIFYAHQYMARYLGRKPNVRFAYTPDSGGKGIVFYGSSSYWKDLFIGSNIDLGGYVQGSNPPAAATLCSATPDGRSFVYSQQFPTLAEIFNITSWRPEFFPRLYLSSLSGERGNIVRTERGGPQPQYDHDEEYEREVGGRLSSSIWLPFIGQCAMPHDPELEIISTPDTMRPDYMRTFDRRMSDIDVCDNALAPTFLSCAIERESTESRSDSITGGGYATWGSEYCGWGADSGERECIGNGSNREHIYNQEFVDEVKITLSGWGSTSTVTVRNESSSRDVSARETVDGVVTSETSSTVHDGSISVEMDGIVIMQESNMPAVDNPLATVLWTLPPSLTAAGSQGHVYLRFPHTSHPSGSLVAGETYSSTHIYKINLGADGVHALACFSIKGTLVGSGGQLTLDPATVERKLIIGRIFGFGISREGFEVPPELMDERLFIAYDPLEKKFSDIYTHPIYFQ